ncbi:hypothetical protein BFS06_14595 [Clostridium perfringens]|uniref:Uncharacterized protein n=1 Tax=Clostridium perfringens TaxID=1502 RepID=A0A140GR86_CLOPF|nr:hypothetical protein [Clostridium perfringens]AMN31045.1 hypothetical protein JFP838_pA0129 [Clostridium perfringens]TBX14434.1 hypothetical protein BFS06_14595 [Clostridium perfringens]
MKLKNDDKELLKTWGYCDKDIQQIEEATKKTIYIFGDKKISTKKAIEILGKEEYLSGISRSAFHFTSARSNKEGDTVFFDSSKLFED